MMYELVAVGSLLIGKHENLIIENCESNVCVMWGGNKIINHGYSLWFSLGGVAKCRKNIGMGVLRENEKMGIRIRA
jgi:hypothetical protein